MMRGFADRPKSLAPTTKRAFTSEDVPKPPQVAESASMRRASTNEDLVSMEIEALSTAPPLHRDDWAHKQLMGMVNRNADGQRVVGEEDDLRETQPALPHISAFANYGKSKSVIGNLEPLSQSPPLASVAGITQPRTLISSSSTSALPVGNLRRDAKSAAFENRLRLKREKDQHMARMIMEEEHKKAKDREKLREAEERMKAKAIREQQDQQPYYEHEKQSQQASPHSSSDDNFAYFRSMKKKIKDINVKPTLPSIGLDEKLKKLNTRVKGFLNTNQPSFSLPIQKFRDKRNSKQLGKNMPIKLNIVDDFMKDLELQRLAEESSMDPRDGLSPGIQRSDYDIHSSTNSSPSEAQQKQAKRSRKRIMDLRLANNSTNELQLLVRSLNQDLQVNNDAILAAQRACIKIREEMEKTKTIFTIDIAGGKISRASGLGTQLVNTVQDIRTQLDTTRTATTACSDQIKKLEVHVQKVQRTKKPADKLVRYLLWIPIGLLMLYFVIKSPTAKMLLVFSVFVLVMRTLRDQNPSPSVQLSNFKIAPAQYDDEHEDLTDSSEIEPLKIPTEQTPPSFSSPKKLDSPQPAGSSIRRNHSDVVLQSLLSEEEFAEAFADSPRLRVVMETDDVGISPKSRIKNNPQLVSKSEQESSKAGSSTSRTASNARGPLRTSATNNDSAMNLALHNLNQMSLKIQQMQQGK